ncbi:sensor histidine kinase [Actinophytocola gossypii]|uniref:histidine kinase n=1 Tax=Actinophytocola gossypii TaxID=2812003 RepID=A0ABT2JDH6_9PSEU|nr:nitrate- and nitrite sensing domain-containing protein [Actinophytocola gossypii]MCT2585490.1 sensor histidine kinase [Actinophytocola gossypii]
MNRAWAAVAQWRNWPLLVKLAAVLVVPVVGALVLGVLRVNADVELAESYDEIERVAALRVELGRALEAMQDERNEAARGGEDLTRFANLTDSSVDLAQAALHRAPDLGRNATARHANVLGALALLPYVRDRVAEGGDPAVILSSYNAVTNAVLEFDRALVGRFPDERLASTSIALNELQAVREQVGVQHAAGLLGMRDGRLSPGERELIVEADIRLEENLRDFRAVAPEPLRALYESTVAGSAVADRKLLVGAADSAAPRFTLTEWDAVSTATAGLMNRVSEGAAADLRAESRRLADSVSDRAGAESVLLLTLVLLAAGIGGGLGRYLLRSLGTLRRTVLDVASNRLPAAVTAIRSGESDGVHIDPVPLRTTEEFGQLARAFDMVHEQAVRSAGDEAELRSDLSNIFLNLSRRSQGLVERQLKQLEQLEQKADDPEQLANLFRIDHLATRMRRNNENLMVLSGAVLGRRFTEPVPLSDVLRAAVSEVEHYQRALVRSAPGVRIVGYAAGDLIRSVAELIENATTFSPPDSQVVVESRLDADGSLRVEILDQGVGMADAELREANERVAAGGGVDVPISRQMGLFVVGRLTAKHGVSASLRRREDQGLCASVHVPAGLVAGPAPVPIPAPGPAPEQERSGNVAGRLELAGIHVRVPEFPSARTPASILFTAHTPVDALPASPAPPAADEFTWLRRPLRGPAPGPPPTPPAQPTAGADGLPKRVPKGQLLVPRTGGPPPGAPAKRDAARARGFLNGFQAGVRDSRNRKEEA